MNSKVTQRHSIQDEVQEKKKEQTSKLLLRLLLKESEELFFGM